MTTTRTTSTTYIVNDDRFMAADVPYAYTYAMESKHYTAPPLTKKRVAIIGFAEVDRPLVPWDDETLEIWGLNMAHGWMPRWDRLFEMHGREEIKEETAELIRHTDHLGALQRERTRPIYMLEGHDDIPCSVAFPLARLQAFCGEYCDKLQRQPYVTSSFGYMMGMAIMDLVAARKDPWKPEGEEILIFGVPLLNEEEYSYQRENARFFAGFAIGRGIKLTLTHHASWLEADGLYGYANQHSLDLLTRLKKACTEERDAYVEEIKKLDAEFSALQRRVNTLDGCRQQSEKMLHRFTLLIRGAKL